MNIEILHYMEGARQAKGIAVVVDVFRAFSTACFIMLQGASRLITVSHVDEAYQLKEDHPEYLLAGERDGIKLQGFYFGNSPSEIMKSDLAGSTVVLTTSAGTKGLLEARNRADAVVTGSFVNAGATADWIRRQKPKDVSIICMGWNAAQFAEEDQLYAGYLKGILSGTAVDYPSILNRLTHERTTPSFLDLPDTGYHQQDLELCLDLDRLASPLRLSSHENQMELVLV